VQPDIARDTHTSQVTGCIFSRSGGVQYLNAACFPSYLLFIDLPDG